MAKRVDIYGEGLVRALRTLGKYQCAEAAKPEYEFDPSRAWLFDLAWPDAMLAAENHGGTFPHWRTIKSKRTGKIERVKVVSGRHTRGVGFAHDREKMRAAQIAGWMVLEYTTEQLADLHGVAAEIAGQWEKRRR